MMTRNRLLLASVIVVALVAAACGDDDDATSSASEPEPAAEAEDSEPAAEAEDSEPAADSEEPAEALPADSSEGVDLASVCPNPLVIQAGWYPENTRAWFWSLIEDGEADTNTLSYSGPAKVDPDLTIEVRAGGPAVGFQENNSLLYSDRGIFMADDDLDSLVRTSGSFPTVAVMAPLTKHPEILHWDPEDLQIETIADIRDSGATVLVAPGAASVAALSGLGLLDDSQIDDSWDFSPTRFLLEDGLVQQGFVTDAAYTFEFLIEEYGRPIDYLLLGDAGYPNYGVMATVHPETITAEADCLELFVPVVQQSVIDFFSDPAPTNALVADLSVAFESPFPATVEDQQFGSDVMINEGLVANGPSGFIGEFDVDRVEGFIELVLPIFEGQGAEVNADLTAADLVNGDFLDPDIGF